MHTESDELLTGLIARLPELEWKISGLGIANHSLPKGLFRTYRETNGSAYVAEIKEDLQSLSQQKNARSALYLAERIRQKVNVLVALCHMHKRRNKSEEKVYFGVKMLGTRQQWINDLEADIHVLETQQQAMHKTLEQMLRGNNAEAILQLKAELGEIERRLTLARETLNRAVS